MTRVINLNDEKNFSDLFSFANNHHVIYYEAMNILYSVDKNVQYCFFTTLAKKAVKEYAEYICEYKITASFDIDEVTLESLANKMKDYFTNIYQKYCQK